MTGFARVTENVLKHLDDKFEICVLGHNWWGDPTPLQDRTNVPVIQPISDGTLGVQRIREIVEREKPDIVFTINDIWIINQQYQQIADLHEQKKFKFVGYAPMDSYNWIGLPTQPTSGMPSSPTDSAHTNLLPVVSPSLLP